MLTFRHKSPAMRNLLDIRSIGLCIVTYILNIVNNVASVDMKMILSFIALLSGITTVGYNAIKFIQEVRNFFIKIKWKRKRKADKKIQEKIVEEKKNEELDKDTFD